MEYEPYNSLNLEIYADWLQEHPEHEDSRLADAFRCIGKARRVPFDVVRNFWTFWYTPRHFHDYREDPGFVRFRTSPDQAKQAIIPFNLFWVMVAVGGYLSHGPETRKENKTEMRAFQSNYNAFKALALGYHAMKRKPKL